METEPVANEEQVKGLIRGVIIGVSGYAGGKGWLGEGEMALIVALTPAILTVGYGWYLRTRKNLIKSTANLENVTAVVVPAAVMADSKSLTEHPKVSTAF